MVFQVARDAACFISTIAWRDGGGDGGSVRLLFFSVLGELAESLASCE